MSLCTTPPTRPASPLFGLACLAVLLISASPASARQIVDEPLPPAQMPAAKPPSEPASGVASERIEDAGDDQPATPAPEAEPRLRFNFRFQRWVDVLQWVAEQADLSLVLDAPPPGTFNYTDARDYTPTEAIDLLNGVLLTKGYTLIRRDRMLLVLPVKDGIPEGLVPRVAIHELDQRGRFEMVSVLFPLGRRDAEEVSTEIKPLLSPHGKVVSLPKTRQLLVTDTAGIMRAVGVVIESIPEPPAPKKPAEPEKPARPEKPEYGVHPVDGADPRVALEVLNMLLPDAKIALDEKARQINAYVTPSQMAVVKSVLQQMQSHHPPEERPRLEVYSVGAADPNQLAATLGPMAPNALLSANSETGKLIAWAEPKDHETIGAALEKLTGIETGPIQNRQVEVYRLVELEPNVTLELLQGLVPNARLAVDPQTRSLIAVALPAEQRSIGAVLEQLRPSQTFPLEIYTLTKAEPTTTLALLQNLVPAARLSFDAGTSKLAALASPEDQKIIASTLEQLQPEQPGPNTPELRFHALARPPASTLVGILQKLAPKAQITLDAGGRRLIVVASPADHETIEKNVEQIERSAADDEDNKLVVYPVTDAQRRRFQMVLTTVLAELPGARMIADAEPGELAVWAKPSQHEVLADVLEQVKRDVPREEKYRLVAYSLESADPNSVLTMAQTLFPDTKIVLDAKGRSLLIWASSEKHETIKEAIEAMDSGAAGASRDKFMVYPVTKATPTVALTMLQPLVPDARLQIDPQAGTIVALARPADHATIARALEQMQADPPPESRPRMAVYPIVGVDPATVSNLLSGLAPKSRITVDAKTRSVLAWATPEEQETIRVAIERIAESDSVATMPTVAAYAVGTSSQAGVLNLLRQAVPSAQFSPGIQPGQVIALARPSEQELIARIVERASEKMPEDKAFRVAVYTIDSMPVATAIFAVAVVAPDARCSAGADPSKVIVWARPDDHAIVKAALEQLETAGAGSGDRVLSVYPMKADDARSFMQVLDPQLRANVQFVTDPKRESLIVWADTQRQEQIRVAVEQFTKDLPALQETVSEVYRLHHVEPQSVVPALRALVPTAQFVPDAQNGSVTAVALPEDQARIKAAVAGIDRAQAEGFAATAEVHRLTVAEPQNVLTVLNGLFRRRQDVQLSIDTQNRAVVAVAPPAEQEKIRGLIEQIEKEAGESKVAVYTLEAMRAPDAVRMLQAAFPQARFATGTDPNKLVAWARSHDQETIEVAIRQIESEGSPIADRTLAVYPMRKEDATSLLQALTPTLREHAQFVSSPNQDRLIVWAERKYHEAIKKAVDDFSSELARQPRPVAEVYPLRHANPQAALTVLRALVPEATLAANPLNRTIVASALPEYQLKIRAAVEQMDDAETQGRTPQLRAHAVNAADPLPLLPMLQRLFAGRQDVQLSVDEQTSRIVAVAPPDDQETIRKLIEEVEQGVAGSSATVQIYPLGRVDATAALQLLGKLFEKQRPKVELSTEPRSNQLVAVARAEQHALIQSALEQLQRDEPELEIFQLHIVDPYTAEMAISRLFSDNYWDAPIVDSDANTQQLFVRAKKEQLVEIRKLLGKMGETRLAGSSGAERGRLRVIPFDGDPDAAMAEVLRLWPRLRDNPIRVVAPSEPFPPSRLEAPSDRPHPDDPAEDAPPRDESSEQNRDSRGDRSASSRATPSAETATTTTTMTRLASRRHAVAETPVSRELDTEQADSPSSAIDPDERNQPSSSPPVVILPGETSLTIASDDTDALDQLESLLRGFSGGRSQTGRNHTVFVLKNADARDVAETVQQLFRATPERWRRREVIPTTIVAHPRTNSLVVHAGRADREVIENLVRALDSPEMSDGSRPTVIRVKNTKAERVEQVVREVFGGEFRRQGGPGGGRVANQPQLAVDDTTNSLIVMARGPLVDEIKQLVASLDETAGADPARGMKIMTLKHTNSQRVEAALDTMLRENVRARRRDR